MGDADRWRSEFRDALDERQCGRFEMVDAPLEVIIASDMADPVARLDIDSNQVHLFPS